MGDNVTIRDASGATQTVATDEVTDGTLGVVEVQYVKILDGDLGGTTKYGQTNAFPVQGKQSGLNTGSIIAATTVVGPFACVNYNLATVGVTGTYAGVSFVFEGSMDGGTTYPFALQGTRTDAFVAELGSGATVLVNQSRAWDVPIGGLTNFRVRATAWTSGTAAVGIIFQTMPFEPAPTVGLAPPVPLTPAAPTVASVGVSSAQAVASNVNRKGLVLVNNSAAVISLGFGATAILNDGITLQPNGGVFEMDTFTFTTNAVNAIAAAAASSLGIQEFS